MLSFSHRTGTHKGFEYFLDLAEPIAGFLLRLGADPHLGMLIVQNAGSGLDQEIVVAVDVSRITKLPHQHHATLIEIVKQYRGGVAAVIGLALHGLPFAVGAAPLERRALQRVVIVGEEANLLDADSVGNRHDSLPTKMV